LNPASMPFFPGGFRPSDDVAGSGFGFRHNVFREQDRTSLSSLSISSSDHRSVRSSPSPPTEAREASPHRQRSPEQEWPRRSSAVHQVGPNPMVESKTKESSTLGTLDTLAEGDDNLDTPGLEGNEVQPLGASFFSLQKGSPDYTSTPPVNVNHGASVGSGVTSASPVSSLDSASHFSTDRQSLSFEAQLKSSPMIHDILERLIRCEYSTREIQRDLSDVHRKVDLLVGRSSGTGSQPEFKDPFATPNTNGFSISPPLPNGPRPSIGNIAPNQSIPSDDITMISQRLNTLTSSVGQLLALQTQHAQPSNTESRSNSIIGSSPQQGDITPNQIFSPPALPNPALLGNGLPHRSDMRHSPRPPHPPTRTWSAGTLDLPMRPSDPSVGRQDPMLRDKRRSVTGLLRRDSSGVSA
jgi:translation initiation factor 4A